jgi:hypothetical protein
LQILWEYIGDDDDTTYFEMYKCVTEYSDCESSYNRSAATFEFVHAYLQKVFNKTLYL